MTATLNELFGKLNTYQSNSSFDVDFALEFCEEEKKKTAKIKFICLINIVQ